jgi:hypothetical protein
VNIDTYIMGVEGRIFEVMFEFSGYTQYPILNTHYPILLQKFKDARYALAATYAGGYHAVFGIATALGLVDHADA